MGIDQLPMPARLGRRRCDLRPSIKSALLILSIGAASASPVLAADGSSTAPMGEARSLGQMTPAQRAVTGVDRLTDAERAALEAWMAGRLDRQGKTLRDGVGELSSAPAPAPAPGSAPVVTPVGEVVVSAAPAAASEAAIEAEVERRVNQKLSEAKAFDVLDDKPFEAELGASFTGWSGDTLFTLTNGQVWRQRSNTRYRHQSSDRRVRFEKNWLGGWEMTVLDGGRSVTVKRVK